MEIARKSWPVNEFLQRQSFYSIHQHGDGHGCTPFFPSDVHKGILYIFLTIVMMRHWRGHSLGTLGRGNLSHRKKFIIREHSVLSSI